MIITAGAINRSIYYYIVQDASNTSPGEPITGLLFSDIETGGSASYARQGAARVDLTLITLASASAAHADGGFIEVDATNMPGVYRCDYPDAAWATGVDQVFCSVVVASAKNAVAAPISVDISDVDLRDAVRGGMTALPDADADAAGGMPISDGGGLDLDALNAAAIRLTAARAQVLDDWINAGRLDVILDAIKAVTDLLPDAGALTTIGADTARLTAARAAVLTDWINGGRLDLILDSRMAEASINTTGGAIDNVTLVGTTINNTDMRGTDSANTTKTGYSLSAAAIDSILDEVVETEGSYTLRQILKTSLAVLAGVTADGGATLKTPDGTKTRVAATIDGSNNRTAITLTPDA